MHVNADDQYIILVVLFLPLQEETMTIWVMEFETRLNGEVWRGTVPSLDMFTHWDGRTIFHVEETHIPLPEKGCLRDPTRKSRLQGAGGEAQENNSCSLSSPESHGVGLRFNHTITQPWRHSYWECLEGSRNMLCTLQLNIATSCNNYSWWTPMETIMSRTSYRQWKKLFSSNCRSEKIGTVA